MVCFTICCFQYEKAVKYFGEDPHKTQPDEFFGVFAQFISSFYDAVVENERFKKLKEDEERRAKLELQVGHRICTIISIILFSPRQAGLPINRPPTWIPTRNAEWLSQKPTKVELT